jgi:hypothetical protein
MGDQVTPSAIRAAHAAPGKWIPVRSSIERFFLRWFFAIIPAVYILRLGVQYAESGALPYALLDRVKIASELALLIVLALANTFLATIGPTIMSLFANGAVVSRTREPGDLQAIQAACERTIDRLLNHRARIPVAATVALATLVYYLTRMGGLSIFVSGGSLLNMLDVGLYFVPTVCYAYFVGVIFWKLFVTSLFFQSFPERFPLVPRFLHPDGACGLLPVGDLCLSMMYVAVVPTVLSGVFLLAYFAPGGIAAYLTPNNTLLFGFTPLILGIGMIGIALGFLPLFRFHLAIVEHRHEWVTELKTLAERIMAEKAKLLHPSENSGEPLDATLRRVNELQLHYEASRKVRMWPLDSGLLVRIWGSVALVSSQLLAFMETIGKVS